MEDATNYYGPEPSEDEKKQYADWARFDAALIRNGVYAPPPAHIVEALVDGEKVAISGRSHDPRINVFLTRNQKDDAGASDNECGQKIRNAWRLKRPYNGVHGTMYIVEDASGIFVSFEPKVDPARQRLNMWFESMHKRCRIENRIKERVARQKLDGMLSLEQQVRYELEGMFAETSTKSSSTYVLRRGRPTVAMSRQPDGLLRAVCALCLHPLAYYEDTWAGVLVPTDEVIAHLLYIRGDEYGFWKRANQIPLDDPRSGV